MIKVTEHKISFFDDTEVVIIPVVQGDTGRVLRFIPTDATLSSNYTATWFVKKPSKKAVYYDATISGNSVICELTAQALAEKGDAYLNIRVYEDDDVISAFRVLLKVQESPVDAIESKNETNIFDEAVAQAMEEIGEILDPTLSIQNKAADAKAVGDALADNDEFHANVARPYVDVWFYPNDIVSHEGTIYIKKVNTKDTGFTPANWTEKRLDQIITQSLQNVAANYNSTKTYKKDDCVLYCGTVYRAMQDIDTAEEWTANHWFKTNAISMSKLFDSNVKTEIGETFFPAYDSTVEHHTVGEVCIYEGVVYRCIEEHFVLDGFYPDAWEAVKVTELIDEKTISLGEDEDGFITISLGES